jgi:hypothetical protein
MQRRIKRASPRSRLSMLLSTFSFRSVLGSAFDDARHQEAFRRSAHLPGGKSLTFLAGQGPQNLANLGLRCERARMNKNPIEIPAPWVFVCTV